MFKWLKRIVDEANSTPNAADAEAEEFSDRPQAPVLKSGQTERLVAMMNELEALGIVFHQNVDRHAAAKRIFEEYWHEWGGHPSMPPETGVLPRSVMLYYLANSEIDWNDILTSGTTGLLKNACNCDDKLEWDRASILWLKLTEITGGDFKLENEFEDLPEFVLVAGQKHKVSWKEISRSNFLEPIFKLVEFLPQEKNHRFHAFETVDGYTVVYAKPKHVEALSQFLWN